MEEYVTDSTLSQLPVNTAYPDLTLRCVVLATVPLRTCEFSDEKVFTTVGSVAPLSLSNGGAAACTKPVRINFYGAWGMAASFLDPGDVVILNGFVRLAAPLTSTSASPSPSLSPPVFVCPVSESDGGALRVLQPSRGGDVMEVLVSPSSMDAVCMRGLTATDRANHLYMQQCAACAAVPS